MLIIGSVPPQIGGVSIHVERFLSLCNSKNYEYKFFDYKREKIYKLISRLQSTHFFHAHPQNPLFLLFLSIFSILFRKKMIFTYHGNFKPNYSIYSFIESLVIRSSYIPIMINLKSYNNAKKMNKKAVLFSAFIPPQKSESLLPEILKKANNVRRTTQMLFATNAYDLVYDINGNEVYGILDLVKIFNEIPHLGLIISDPSGSYCKFFHKEKIKLNNNVMVISELHPFVEILKISDCLIRNTTTDGDSLSIKEALYFRKKVLASNCVARPEEVQLIKSSNKNSIKNDILCCFAGKNILENQSELINGGDQVIDLYNKLLKK